MSRFNKSTPAPKARSVIVSTPSPTAKTGNNAPGFVRDAKSELFLLGVANFVGQNTFYEGTSQRDERYVNLIAQVAAEDPAWLSCFLIWLRDETNMRTAAIVGAVEFCRAHKETNVRTGNEVGYPRLAMGSVLQRADEPGEALGYFTANYGRKLPMSLKRGVADAAARLYNEYSTLKYDTASHAFRFGDVLELTHAKPVLGRRRSIADIAAELGVTHASAIKHQLRRTGERILAEAGGEDLGVVRQINEIDKFVDQPFARIPGASWRLRSAARTLEISPSELSERLSQWIPSRQSHLFKHLIDRRHNRDELNITGLDTIIRNGMLRAVVAEGDLSPLLDSDALREAGMTWEDALSLAGDKVPKRELWEALIPTMGYMALIRNLRNFDEAGVSDAVAGQVVQRLISPERVERSRQLPMRFLSAYNAVSNLRWAYPLEQALNLSLRNVPEFGGNTLILIDTSGSMSDTFSKDGTLRRWDAAAVFGLALAQRCQNATVVSFADRSAVFPMTAGASLLTLLSQFKGSYFFGGGTETARAVRQYYQGHDRVVVLTDEQANYHGHHSVFASVPDNRMTITFNLAGYRVGHAESGSAYRVTIGGLTDQAFRLLPILEQRAAGQWPF